VGNQLLIHIWGKGSQEKKCPFPFLSVYPFPTHAASKMMRGQKYFCVKNNVASNIMQHEKTMRLQNEQAPKNPKSTPPGVKTMWSQYDEVSKMFSRQNHFKIRKA